MLAAIHMKPNSEMVTPPWISPAPVLSIASKAAAMIWAILLCVCYGDNPAVVVDVKPTTPRGEAAVAPGGWKTLEMVLDGGAKRKSVLIRDGAHKEEARAAIAEGCREVGVDDDQASSVFEKWIAYERSKLESERTGYDRTGFMFEETGSKKIFERFLGELATRAEEQPLAALETGSWEGASASWIAEHLLKHPSSLLVCLDTWDGGRELENTAVAMDVVEDRFQYNMAQAPNGERVIAFKGDSHESLSYLLEKGLMSSFDAVYVDASHDMKDVLGDAMLSFRLLKIGGVMIFDDYWMRGVARATVAFEEAFGDFLEVMHRDLNHLVVTKRAEDRFAKHDSHLVLGDESRLEVLVDTRRFS